MKCSRCGNQVSPDEAFCGQCGAPTSPPAGPTEMVNTPPRSGLLHSYPTNGSFGSRNTYDFSAQPPANTQNSQLPPSARASTPQQPAMRQSAPNQEEGFYQDATEAMSVLPSNPAQNYPTGQQPFPDIPGAGAYPTVGQPSQYGYQADAGARPQTPPFQAGYYPGQGYPQQPFQGVQGYDQGMMYGGFTAPAPKQRSNTAIIVLSICLAIALISLVGFGTLYLLRNQNNPNASQTQGGQGAVPTTVPTPTATTVPEPTPTPTLAPTATTAPPTPTPTAVPTAAADPGFISCGDQCTANGFVTEYPQGWQTTRSGDGLTIQFANAKPTQTDQSATFKTPGATTSSAGDLVTNDLQTNFATKNGYTVVSPPSPTATATIGGQPWTQGIATYQGDTQKERVEVYAINYGGKAYIIELQAPDALFDAINTQYFVNMIGRFQFQ